jgi:hypothetical protein
MVNGQGRLRDLHAAVRVFGSDGTRPAARMRFRTSTAMSRMRVDIGGEESQACMPEHSKHTQVQKPSVSVSPVCI